MRGLDPRIHQNFESALRAMDCRIKSGNDDGILYCADHHAHVLRCGSTRSRRPSPSRLKQNTAIISAPPGKNATPHSPEMILVAPSATMMPHSGVGGLTPRPTNDSPAALRMA